MHSHKHSLSLSLSISHAHTHTHTHTFTHAHTHLHTPVLISFPFYNHLFSFWQPISLTQHAHPLAPMQILILTHAHTSKSTRPQWSQSIDWPCSQSQWILTHARCFLLNLQEEEEVMVMNRYWFFFFCFLLRHLMFLMSSGCYAILDCFFPLTAKRPLLLLNFNKPHIPFFFFVTFSSLSFFFFVFFF